MHFYALGTPQNRRAQTNSRMDARTEAERTWLVAPHTRRDPDDIACFVHRARSSSIKAVLRDISAQKLSRVAVPKLSRYTRRGVTMKRCVSKGAPTPINVSNKEYRCAEGNDSGVQHVFDGDVACVARINTHVSRNFPPYSSRMRFGSPHALGSPETMQPLPGASISKPVKLL